MKISNSTLIQFKNGENDAVAEVYFALKPIVFIISSYMSN